MRISINWNSFSFIFIDNQSVVCSQQKCIGVKLLDFVNHRNMIRNLYEFELSGLKIVMRPVCRLGNQINNSIRFFDVLEREIAVYLLLSYDRDSLVGQYPFISLGIFENGIYLVSLQVLFEGAVQSDSFPLLASWSSMRMAAHRFER